MTDISKRLDEKRKVLEAILADKTLTKLDILVGVTLLYYFHNTENGACFPAQDTIAKVVGVARPSVSRSLERLRRAGHLKTKSKKWRSLNYIFRLMSPYSGSTCHPPVTSDVTRRLQEMSPAGYPNREGNKEQNREKKRERAKRATRTPLSESTEITTRQIETAGDLGITEATANEEFERFRDYHLAKGNSMASWDAAWRNWCRNHLKFKAVDEAKAQEDDEETDIFGRTIEVF